MDNSCSSYIRYNYFNTYFIWYYFLFINIFYIDYKDHNSKCWKIDTIKEALGKKNINFEETDDRMILANKLQSHFSAEILQNNITIPLQTNTISNQLKYV